MIADKKKQDFIIYCLIIQISIKGIHDRGLKKQDFIIYCLIIQISIKGIHDRG